MFAFRPLSSPVAVAAILIVVGVAAAIRLSDWGAFTANRLILEPIQELLRLAW